MRMSLRQQKRAWQKGGASVRVFSQAHGHGRDPSMGRLEQLTPSIEGNACSFHEHRAGRGQCLGANPEACRRDATAGCAQCCA